MVAFLFQTFIGSRLCLVSIANLVDGKMLASCIRDGMGTEAIQQG